MNLLRYLLKNGLGHIFTANVLQKFCMLATSFILVRILPVNDYGVWAFSLNFLMFFFLFQNLGFHMGILQFVSLNSDKETCLSYMSYGKKLSFASNIVIVVIGYIIIYTIPLKIPESKSLLQILLFAVIFSGYSEGYLNYYRGRLQNRLFSTLTIFRAITHLILLIVSAYFWGVNGLAIAFVSTWMLTSIASFILDKERIEKSTRIVINKLEFIKYSLLSTLNNAISQFLYLIDTHLIGQIISSGNAVALYKTASMIPFNLTFLPISIMTFVYPYFCKNINNQEYLRTKYLKLIKMLALVNGAIVITLYFGAPFLIKLIFTEKYMEAVPAFRVLIIGFFFASTFRIPAGNTLAALHKVKWNLIVALISGVTNIILDAYLIQKIGIIGAAYSTTTIYILSSVISNAFIYSLIRKNK